jgi:hypothetical protein
LTVSSFAPQPIPSSTPWQSSSAERNEVERGQCKRCVEMEYRVSVCSIL